jgi:hypothetical protein
VKDIKAEVAKKRKVALYQRMDSDNWFTLWEVQYSDCDENYRPLPDGELREEPLEGYVRITEPVEVTFTAIGNDEIVAKAVEALNAEEQKVIRELNKKLADIRGRKNQLLALTHESAA